VEDIGAGTTALLEPIEQLVNKSGLTSAGLSGENHEALASLNAEEEFGQSGFMGAGATVETRIRGDMKGVLSHAKEVIEVVVSHVLGQTTPMGGGRTMELYEKKGRGATRKKEEGVTECAETGYRTRQFQYLTDRAEAFGAWPANGMYQRVTI